MYIGLTDVTGFMSNALRTLFAFLCEFIYPLIADLYGIFRDMGTIVYSDGFSKLYDKITLIIGIFMVFRVIFWLIELLINPAGISDKEKKPINIVSKVFISLLLLVFTPTIFEWANIIQVEILNERIIEKIIAVDTMNDAEDSGNRLAADLFVNFYTPNEKANDNSCKTYAGKKGTVYEDLRAYGTMEYLNNYCLNAVDDVKVNEKEVYFNSFNGIFATAVGGFVLWMLLMYCIEVGVRFVQLIYLQVIAPIPIMCYIVPGKDNMFTKWLKQCTTTYIDLFIRIAIINFIMLLSTLILTNDKNFIQNFANDNWIIEVFLVLGLLTFAKKAPALIQELIPSSSTKASGDFGLSLKKKTDNMLGGKTMYNTAKRAPGYVAGGVGGALFGAALGAMGGKGVGSRIMGALTGAGRGFTTGSKKGNVIKNLGDVKKNQAAQNRKLQQWRIAAGKGENDANTIGDWWARTTDSFKSARGFETSGDRLKRATEFATATEGDAKQLITWGSEKALIKNRSLSAFGKKGQGIADIDTIRKNRATEAAEFTAEKMLTTPEGLLKLKNTRREMHIRDEKEKRYQAILASKGILATDNSEQAKEERKKARAAAEQDVENNRTSIESAFDATYVDPTTDATGARVATEASEFLIRLKNEADQEFDDLEKKAGFLHLVEELSGGKNQNVQNRFKNINEFLEENQDIAERFGLTHRDGKKYFEADELERLRIAAEGGDKKSQDDLLAMFEAFNRTSKELSAIYAARNDEQKRATANANWNKGN